MTNWRPDFNPDHIYFLTTTAAQRRHLFKRDVMKRLVVDTLDCMRLRGWFTLYAFVVMPNHVHAILQCSADKPLADVVRDLKKHVADRVIRHYRAENDRAILELLTSLASHLPKARYKVWEDGYNAKDVVSAGFLRQKMDYLHSNPCQPHWALADCPEEYIWSSASFYSETGQAIIPVENVAYMLM